MVRADGGRLDKKNNRGSARMNDDDTLDGADYFIKGLFLALGTMAVVLWLLRGVL